MFVAAGPVSRILSAGLLRQDGHSSGPSIAARLKRPTRRLWRTEPARASGEPEAPSLFGLAPCGVCPARDIAAAAVRSYRTFSPLPRACEAVRFLWHFPSTSLDAGFPDVIRHTALRSSDFPPSSLAVTRAAVRSSCCKLIIIDYEWLRTNRSPMAGSMPGWFAEWPGESNHPWVVHQRTTSGRQGRR